MSKLEELIPDVNPCLKCYFNVVFVLFFVQWTNKCTINWQIIILLLHVLTLLCHLQGARSQYLLSYTIMSIQHWWYNFKISHMVFGCWMSMFKIIKNIKIVLVIIKWLKPWNISLTICMNEFKYRLWTWNPRNGGSPPIYLLTYQIYGIKSLTYKLPIPWNEKSFWIS